MVDPTPTWPPTPDRVVRFGVGASLLLACVSWVAYLLTEDYYVPEIDVGAEGSVGAWASSLALFGAAAWAWSISGRDRLGRRTSWRALAIVFAFLSLDETASIHEKAIDPLQDSLTTSGALLYAWVIPGALAVVVVGLAFVPFLRDLERTTARLLVLAGAIYLGGALGMEAVTGAVASSLGDDHWVYGTLATLEELAEMLGITAFLATLARYDRLLSADPVGRPLDRPVPEMVELD